MDIKNIKEKRNKVACELRKLAKQDWMSIDIDDIHQMIFGTRLAITPDTLVSEYDEYDREICNALADLINLVNGKIFKTVKYSTRIKFVSINVNLLLNVCRNLINGICPCAIVTHL